MKLIQKETITEKKIRKSDGKVFEKTTVHEDVLFLTLGQSFQFPLVTRVL